MKVYKRLKNSFLSFKRKSFHDKKRPNFAGLAVALFAALGIYSSGANAQMANCMGDLSVGNVQGTSTPDDLNCTSNDVSIAETQVLSGPISCLAGEEITVELAANLQSSSNSSRSDIGIWLAEDGGDAISGACQHFYFDNTKALSDLDDAYEDDICGDIGAAELFAEVPLDTPTSSLTLICRDGELTDPDNQPDGELDVGSCIAWKVPGDDEVCSTDDNFALGTLPANKAKCNCGNISIPIIVNQVGYVEVIKEIIPDTSTDTFDLLINGAVKKDDAGDGDTTGKVEVSAGTAVNPGADVTVAETGDNLDVYTNVLSCVDRDTGAVIDTGSPNATSATFEIQPDDDVVCTFTNKGVPPTLTLIKKVLRGDAGDTFTLAEPDDFKLTVDDKIVSSGEVITTTVGMHEAGETQLDGYESELGWEGDCASNGSITLALGENKTCTITNTAIPPKLTLEKIVVGGTALPNDFNLTVDGVGVSSGVAITTTVGPRTAAEDEDAVLGYEKVGHWGGDCDEDGGITLALGDDAKCTITNEFKATYLTLKKELNPVNGAIALESEFELTANAQVFTQGLQTEVDAGPYTLDEDDNTGTDFWTLQNLSCDDGGTTSTTNRQVELAVGANVTCTFTNTDSGFNPNGYLVVKKVIVGGTATCADFGFTIDSTPAEVGQWTGASQTCDSTVYELPEGTYSVTENPYTVNYSKDESACSNVEVTRDNTPDNPAVCTIVNTVNPDLIPTRTIGYWKTHPDALAYYFSQNDTLEYCGGNKIEVDTDDNGTLDDAEVDRAVCEAVSTLSLRGGGEKNAKRQSLAAALNCLAFGCDIDPTAHCTRANGSIWDAYNSNELTDGIANPIGHGAADSKYCK